jgi:hypothetical protein
MSRTPRSAGRLATSERRARVGGCRFVFVRPLVGARPLLGGLRPAVLGDLLLVLVAAISAPIVFAARLQIPSCREPFSGLYLSPNS